MNGKYLEKVIEERDLGVIMQSDLKCSKQCLKAVSMANNLFVCLLLNGTSALFRPLVPRIVEIEHTNHVENDLK